MTAQDETDAIYEQVTTIRIIFTANCTNNQYPTEFQVKYINTAPFPVCPTFIIDSNSALWVKFCALNMFAIL